MTEVELMAFGSGDAHGAPTLLMRNGGLWCETQPPTGRTLVDTRPALRDQVKHVVEDPDAGEMAEDGLVAVAISLADDLLGPDVKDALEDARTTCARDEPPLLRIHLSPAHDWVPWELLHDGNDFLGRSFRIARLPILANRPRHTEGAKHKVEIVRSVLGKGVTEPHDDDFVAWQATFAGLLGAGVQTDLQPQDPADGWPGTRALRERADILHITCHGHRDTSGRAYWTFDPDLTQVEHRFNSTQFNALRKPFRDRRPLVFANACTKDAFEGPRLPPPFGNDLFDLGALNFVGTVSPIRQTPALRFARTFYEALLSDERDIGSAMLEAKRRSQGHAAGDITHLLYCLYGPPEMHYA